MRSFQLACSALAAFLSATSLAADTAVVAAGQDLHIRFEARAGAQVLRCGQVHSGIGLSGADITLQDFRIYVSNVSLLTGDGSELPVEFIPDDLWQDRRVALLDFENASGNCNGNAATHTVLRVRAPTGVSVGGLAFDIGVPVELNHQDPTIAAPPLNFSALTWPWRYGYKHTTIDLETGAPAGKSLAGHAASGFSIHLGSVDCGEGSPRTPPESPCTTPNRPGYRLHPFDSARQVVVLDLAALLARTDVTVNAPDTASGCMSGEEDADCIAIMDRLGLRFRGKDSAGQQFVRVGEAP